MPGKRQYIYWDACAFLSYFNGDPDRLPTLQAILEQVAANKDELILTSTLTIVEVAFVMRNGRRDVSPDELERIEDVWSDRGVLEFAEMHRVVAMHARELIRTAVANGWASLKPADAIHLATASLVARSEKVVEIHTYDTDLHRWSEHLGIPVCDPYIDQPPLFLQV